MELTPNEQQVVNLLSKLKNSNGSYPSDILAARREAYLKQVANLGLGIGIGAGLKHAAKGSGNGAGAAATITSKTLEIILIAAIAVEGSTAAYLYRDKIADLVKTYTGSSNVQVTAPPAGDVSTLSPGLVEIEGSPSATALTPSGTPSPEVAINNNNNNNNATSSSVNATPNPDNNGNQYGLTPKPVRTKDNNSGGSDNGGSNDGGNGNNNGGNGNNKP